MGATGGGANAGTCAGCAAAAVCFGGAATGAATLADTTAGAAVTANDGVMTGLYPAYTVVSGEHFKAKIGFLAKADGSCGVGNVKFQLNYKESGVLKPLGEWTDTCDGVLKDVDVDLSSIANKNVQFALAVLANGPATQDSAVWVSPRVERP